LAERADTNPADISGLTDADWAEISSLMRTYKAGGEEALLKAMNELNKQDPDRYVRIVSAL